MRRRGERERPDEDAERESRPMRSVKTALIDLPGMTISLNGAIVSSYGDRPGEKQGDFSKEEWRIDAASAQ